MTGPAKEPTVQTMTVVGKALVTDDSTALVLGLLGVSATKLWNTAVWHTREVWSNTGKIPTDPELDGALKQDHPLWYRRLHSQSAQLILEELRKSYQSWFALRKKGDRKAHPPGYRRKTVLSTVTFKQSAVTWNARTSTVCLSMPKDSYGKQFLFLKLCLPHGSRLTEDNVQIGRLVHENGTWFVHLANTIPLPLLSGEGETMAADLGMKDLAATACKDGTISLWLGGELAALERYFEMQKAKTTKSTSRKSRALKQKRSGQRSPLLNSFTKSLVRDAEARGVTTIIVGDLKDIREGKDWGTRGNQQLHKWPFDRIVKMLTYKARLKGIRVVEEKEHYTRQTCCVCHTRDKAGRVHRGLYVCTQCGAVIHAEVNGAIIILSGISRSSVVSPGVVVVWHSLRSTGSPGEIPGQEQKPMNRGGGKHLCRIRKQDQQWPSAAGPDSGILGSFMPGRMSTTYYNVK